MEIRIAEKKDIDTLIKFRFAYLTEDSGELSSVQTESLRIQLPDYFNRHIGGDFSAYIAEEDEKPVSVIYLIRVEKPANTHFMSGKTAMLMNVYTLPEYRRKGIASILLKRIITDAGKEGISCIDLSATAMGKPLYLKNGFHECSSGHTNMRIEI